MHHKNQECTYVLYSTVLFYCLRGTRAITALFSRPSTPYLFIRAYHIVRSTWQPHMATDSFFSPVTASDWLILCCADLRIYQKK